MTPKTKKTLWQLLGLGLTVGLIPLGILLFSFLLFGLFFFIYGLTCLIRVPGDCGFDILLMLGGIIFILTGFATRHMIIFLLDVIREEFFGDEE